MLYGTTALVIIASSHMLPLFRVVEVHHIKYLVGYSNDAGRVQS